MLNKKIFLIYLSIVLIPVFIFAYYLPSGEEIDRISTETTYQGSNSAQYSDKANLEVQLVTESSQQGIEGKEINFTLENQEISAISNQSGIANIDLSLNQGAGNYTLLSIFGGDNYFSGSSDSSSFEILKEDLQIEYSGPVSGESGSIIVISVQLSELDEDEGDLSGKRIVFSGGNYTETATTDSQGRAETQISLSNITAGNYTFTVSFEGDAFYMSCSDESDFEVTGGDGGGYNPCFIATAAYGSPLKEEVSLLRDFRDQYLLTNPVGIQFVNQYYKYSPKIADYIREKEELMAIVRTGINPLVEIARLLVYPSE